MAMPGNGALAPDIGGRRLVVEDWKSVELVWIVTVLRSLHPVAPPIDHAYLPHIRGLKGSCQI